MSAQILDGKALAAKLKGTLAAEIKSLSGRTKAFPRLCSIVIGDDPGSSSYIASQQRTAEDLGVRYDLHKFNQEADGAEVVEFIRRLNANSEIHGILINKPVPSHMDFRLLTEAIAPKKDIEGMTLANLGLLFLGQTSLVPCTAAAAVELIKSAAVDLKGKEAVVLGRSEIVGKPVALLLLQQHMTVTICHSQTADLKGHVRRADVVVAAIGKPRFVKGDWLKPGATVVDVGINSENGRIVGDVDYGSAVNVAGRITPVPGGVGPVTSAMLMINLFNAFKSFPAYWDSRHV